jgi:transcriptional regulator with XRE-family HTH domain
MSESAAVWFRRARLRAGYRSQGELARALGLARAAVANWESDTVGGRPSRSVVPHLARLLGVPPEELAARFGIDVERPLAEPRGLEPDLVAAIEEAVARGVARGVREALAERGVEETGATGADQTLTALGVGRRPRVGVARSGDKRRAADITAEPAAEEPH